MFKKYFSPPIRCREAEIAVKNHPKEAENFSQLK
jgi:hypothetical protein